MPSTKWALVTGVSPGGMGEGEVQAFLNRGINVFATAVDLGLLSYLESKNETRASVICLELDVTSPQSIALAVQEVEKVTGGRLDFLMSAYSAPVSLCA